MLFKWNLVESELCSFCQNSKETVTHLFWNCNETQLFVYRMQQWFRSHVGYDMDLNMDSFFLGIHTNALYNLLCILGKLCIYRAKLNGSKPSILLFNDKVRDIYNIEKYIAIKNSKMCNFANK